MGLETHAALSPVSVSVAYPVQFPPSDFNITGVRASLLFGKHRDVYGLDLGVLGNITDQDFVGIGISGLFNVTHGQTSALLQLAGITNINTNKVNIYGAQISALMNMNDAETSIVGLQFALANLSPHTTINGFQIGLYNSAYNVRGFQIGLLNFTENLHGMQIGLLNFNHTGLFVVSPVINIGF